MLWKFIRAGIWAGLCCVALGGGAVAGMYYHALGSLPDVEELKHVSFETPMQVYSRDGKLIGEFGEHKRIPVRLQDIPLHMQQAFLAIEDSRFYEHGGIDPIGILRAGLVAVTSANVSQGASTITQQVARNFFLSRERTLERKIKEVFISWRIEQVLTKDEILELYLNKIALGHRSYGVAAAAQTYYGKDLKDLTLAEMATIAGLPKAPSTLNPISYPERSRDRRHLVLGRMLSLGFITQQEYEEADKAPYRTYYHSTPLDVNAPYVAEEARQYALDKYGEEAYTEGFKIYTTVDSKLQDYANYAIFKGITDYDTRHGYRGPAGNVLTLLADNSAKDEAQDAADEDADTAEDTESAENAGSAAAAAQANQNAASAAQISLAALERPDPELLLKLTTFLQKKDLYLYAKPAVVLAVNDSKKEALLLTKNGNRHIMHWDSMSWARAFKTDSSQGPAPKKPSDFMAAGDLIYTYYDEENKEHLTQIPDVGAALISLNPYDGSIVAMCGGYDFAQSKLNRAFQAKRQPGSNFKPFLYSAALAKGIAVNSPFWDMPIRTWDPGSRTWWEPHNSPNRFEGIMTLREGLAKSKNVVTIRLMRQVGVKDFTEHLHKFGIDVPRSQQVEAMALGSVELTPVQTATGYAVFANGGYKVEPYLIDKVYRGDELLYEATPRIADRNAPDRVINDIALTYNDIPEDPRLAQQVVSHGHAFIMADMLSSVIYGGQGIQGPFYGTGGRAAAYTKRTDLHGKTGTTNDVHDAWFTGFNGNLLATAWMGFDNSRNLGYSRTKGPEGGAYSALPIFTEYFKRAQPPKVVPPAPIPRPEGVSMARNEYGLSDYVLGNSRTVTDEAGDIPAPEEVKNTGTDSSQVQEDSIF